MISLYHLSDAAPVAMFGMFALWAAVSRRHWFVRIAVVAGAILVILLIPAYEPAIELGVESLLVVVGLTVWRRWRRSPAGHADAASSSRFRLQLSLETLLLVVVIVAVATAVASRVPRMEAKQWYSLAVSGLVAAALCLACVWVVCGRSALWFRLLASPLIAILLSVAMKALLWAGYVARYWFAAPNGSIREYLQLAIRDTWQGTSYWIVVVSLGMAILSAMLFLMRRAHWFDPFNDLPESVPRDDGRRILMARWAAAVLFVLVSMLPIALFYRLMTPTPIPKVVLPVPNGFDDFVAAGRMIGQDGAIKLGAWDQLTDAQLRSELARHAAAFARMQDGLQKECWHPYVFKPWVNGDAHALRFLLDALRSRAAAARGKLHDELANYEDVLRLAHAERRGDAAQSFNGILGRFEWEAHTGIWSLRRQLSAAECIQLAEELWELDRRREPWALRAERQRIIDENSGWQPHVWLILNDWSGGENYVSERNVYSRRVAELRVLIVELAIRAYQLDNGGLPKTLTELVPKYLSVIPTDPFGDGIIKYQVSGDTHKLYSVGPDGDDDGGDPIVVEDSVEVGDLIDAELFPRLPASQLPAGAGSTDRGSEGTQSE